MSIRYLPLVMLCLVGVLGAEPKRDRFGDPLPDGAIARLGSLRLRHEQPITAGAFSPDSRMLATVGQGGLLLCWDTATGKEVRRRRANLPFGVNGLRFRADGKALILAGDGGEFRVVDAVTSAEQRKFDSPDRNFLATLQVASDGKIAATVDYKGNVVVWDLPHGKRLHEFKGPAKLAPWPDNVVALTPDGKQLVWPHADGSLHLLDVASGKEVLAFEMPPKRPILVPEFSLAKVAVSPDGRYLAYGGLNTAATLCEVKTGKRVRELPPFTTGILGITGLVFTANSRFLAVADGAKIGVFGVPSGKEVRKLSRPPGAGNVLTFSPDGRMLAAFGPAAVIGAGHIIYLWDVDSGLSLHPPVGHESSAEALVFFPDGKRLASASTCDGLIVWDIAGERGLAQRRGWHTFSPNSFGMSDDGATLRFLDENGILYRWDWRAGRDEPAQILAIPAAKQLVLSPDGRSVAALTSHRSPQLRWYEVKCPPLPASALSQRRRQDADPGPS